ncbi:UNVERIFIED_CONTAM: Vacuolar protein sorting-associated protein 51, partial [Siphonaria sp. JEL0065]
MSDSLGIDAIERQTSSASLATNNSARSTTTTTSKKRSRLKEFYNLKEKDDNQSKDNTATDEAFESQPQSQSQQRQQQQQQHHVSLMSHGGPNIMDMDSPFFVPETFVSKCVNEDSLPDLIAHDNNLVAEIKDLDASMKTLVYGNYNKFIAASDTIRAMRMKVDDMETQMTEFSAKMEAISNQSNEIHGFLGEKRQKIKQLTGVHQLLNKLHFVFELPAKLTSSFKNAKYKDAVLLYTETHTLLDHYKSLALFSKISGECSATMDKVAQKLLITMNHSGSSPAEVSEAVWLLGTLGRGFNGLNDLGNAYLGVMQTQINKLMDTTITQLSAMKRNSALPPSTTDSTTTAGGDTTSNLLIQQTKTWNSQVLKPVSDFLIKFHDLFLSIRDSGGDGFFGANAEKLSFEQKERMERELDNISEGFIKRYFAQIGVMVAVPDDVWSYSATAFILVVDAITHDIVPLRGLTLFLNMTERVRTYAVTYIKNVSDTAFGAAKSAYMEELRKIETPGTSSKQVLEQANTVLKQGILSKAFPLLEKFVDERLGFVSSTHAVSGVEGILELLTECFEGFWTSLGTDLKVISGQEYTPTPLPPPTLLLLIMSRSALSLSASLVDSLFSTFTTTVLKSRNSSLDPNTANSGTSGGYASGSSSTKSQRNKLLIVTAGGGTVPSATSGMSYSTRRMGSNTPADSKDQTELDPKNQQVIKRGKKVGLEWRGIAQSLALRFVCISTLELCGNVRRYVKLGDWMKSVSVDGVGEAVGGWKNVKVAEEWSVGVLGQISGIDAQLRLVYDDESERRDRRQQAPTVSINPASSSPNR